MTQADALLIGSVYTVDPATPRAEALAISNGRILAVGSVADLAAYRGPSTEVMDFSGRSILPGFQDSHVHTPAGGVDRFQCDLSECLDGTAYLGVIEAYAKAHPEVEWIRGGGWYMADFPGGTPTKDAVDSILPDRPMFLTNRDGHGAWVNSKALQLAGIDRHTPDPVDGRIERDASGEPSGTLHEGAMDLVVPLMPEYTREDLERGLLEGQRYLHSLGVTAWQDAIVGSDQWGQTQDIYAEASRRGDLTAKVVGAIWWDHHRGEEQIEELLDVRRRTRSGHFNATSVKIMQDGVLENGTGAMIDPYVDPCGSAGCGHDKDNRGMSFVDPEALKGYVTRLDAEGFQVHFHAIGDRAVREALDAIEAARRANGANDNRHHIAHIQVVHPEDLPRFAALDVVANCQPLWAANDAQMVDLTIPFLGPERAAWQYPFESLRRSGARLAFGSDWSVSSPDPLLEMDIAVNRSEPDGNPEPLLPNERVSLDTAIEAFTMGSAYVNHLEEVTGSIEVGKFADLAVVDRDLFDPDIRRTSEAKVVLTMVEGDVVYEAGEQDG